MYRSVPTADMHPFRLFPSKLPVFFFLTVPVISRSRPEKIWLINDPTGYHDSYFWPWGSVFSFVKIAEPYSDKNLGMTVMPLMLVIFSWYVLKIVNVFIRGEWANLIIFSSASLKCGTHMTYRAKIVIFGTMPKQYFLNHIRLESRFFERRYIKTVFSLLIFTIC